MKKIFLFVFLGVIGSFFVGGSFADMFVGNETPIMYAEPDPCVIKKGKSQCDAPVNIVWDAEGVVDIYIFSVNEDKKVSDSDKGSLTVNNVDVERRVYYMKDVQEGSLERDTFVKAATAVGKCEPGTSWNGSICDGLGRGDDGKLLSATPNPCLIGREQSSCTSLIRWSGGFVYLDGEKITPESSGSESINIPYGGEDLILKNPDGDILETLFVSAPCDSMTTWNGEVCEESPGGGEATLTATPNPCTIPLGESICTSRVSWESPMNVSILLKEAGIVLSTEDRSFIEASWTSPEAMTYELREGDEGRGALLRSVIVRGVCASGSIWDGIICASN